MFYQSITKRFTQPESKNSCFNIIFSLDIRDYLIYVASTKFNKNKSTILLFRLISKPIGFPWLVTHYTSDLMIWGIRWLMQRQRKVWSHPNGFQILIEIFPFCIGRICTFSAYEKWVSCKHAALAKEVSVFLSETKLDQYRYACGQKLSIFHVFGTTPVRIVHSLAHICDKIRLQLNGFPLKLNAHMNTNRSNHAK